MIVFDWQCSHCNNIFEVLQKGGIEISTCPRCRGDSYKVFLKAPSLNLTYDPKTDMCDWDGNSSQYYRSYNEAKARGEDVRLPEEGE